MGRVTGMIADWCCAWNKRWLVAMLIVGVAHVWAPVGFGAEFIHDNLKYDSFGGGIMVTGYVGSPTTVEIPESVNGYSVIAINWYAFSGCDSLTGITIPDSVIYIKSGAFQYCRSLKSIDISEKVTEIGDMAFLGCSQLSSINVSDRNIGYSSVHGVLYDKLQIELICYPPARSESRYMVLDGVNSIASYAFFNCTNLTEIVLPKGTIIPPSTVAIPLDIHSFAFYGCTNLATIAIPEHVYDIPDYAFYGCTSLTSMEFTDSIQSIGAYAFYGCTSLASVKMPRSKTFPPEIVAPLPVDIQAYAFAYCTSLTEIAFDDNVISVEGGAFASCTSLRQFAVNSFSPYYFATNDGVLYDKRDGRLVCYPAGKTETSYTIRSGTTLVEDRAFDGAYSLTGVVIPSTVTSIGSGAFAHCTSLTSAVFPEGNKFIRDWMFDGCRSLTSVSIPSTVTSIGYRAFSSCSSLEGVVIPEGVTSIQGYAFRYCYSLRNILIPGSVTSIGYCAFEYCSGLESIAIPNGVKSIESYTFLGCSGLKNVTLPSGLTSIGYGAFQYCNGLTSISIPPSVVSIDGRAFENCYLLTSVVIPEGVATIGAEAFARCGNLEDVFIPASVRSIGSDAFRYGYHLKGITVDAQNVFYSSVDGVLFNKDRTQLIQYPTLRDGIEYVIPSGVTSIASLAFCGCQNLTCVTIPNTVISIGKLAFYDCSKLRSAVIPASVTSIEDEAFGNCYALRNVYFAGNAPVVFGDKVFVSWQGNLPVYFNAGATGFTSPQWKDYNSVPVDCAYDNLLYVYDQSAAPQTAAVIACLGNPASVTIPGWVQGYRVDAIRDGVFDNCRNLQEVILGDGLTSIGAGSFAMCDGITSVVIPGNVRSIGDWAFSGCFGLKTLVLQSGVTSIGIGAFNGCVSLTGVAIPGSIQTIGDTSWGGCSSLSSLTIGDGVVSIGSGAFAGCGALTSITLPASVTSVGAWSLNTGSRLLEISVDAANPAFSSLDGVLFNKDRTVLIQYPGGKSGTSYAVPASVSSIGDYAFSVDGVFSRITIPASVTSIGDRVFAGALQLTDITVDAANPAFSSIDGVLFNKDKTVLIQYPPGKSEVIYTIPASVTVIGDSAFMGCGSLTGLSIPRGVTTISRWAFNACWNLKRLVIPDTVSLVDSYAFSYCTNLESVYFKGNAPATVGADIFYGNYPTATIYRQATASGFDAEWNQYATSTEFKTFDGWRTSRFTAAELNNPEISDGSAAPDGDGIPNLLKYALGIDDQVQASSQLPGMTVQEDVASLSYTRIKNAPDVVYIPEVSTDLKSWNSGADYICVSDVTDAGDIQIITVQSLSPTSSNPRQYFRLRVVQP